MSKQKFAGDKKAPMVSPLARIEKRFIEKNVDKIPSWLQTYHLTWMTLLWSMGMLGFGYLAKNNLHWLWGSSLMLFLQWFTDCFDGAVGRKRNTGLIKWGYYMDHFLDFVFMWTVFAGYAFLLEGSNVFWLFTLAFFYLALMVHSFLDFSVTNEFQITYLNLGPTEIRLGFILLNIAIIFWGVKVLLLVIPWLMAIFAFGLCFVVYRSQKKIWKIDMEIKESEITNK